MNTLFSTDRKNQTRVSEKQRLPVKNRRRCQAVVPISALCTVLLLGLIVYAHSVLSLSRDGAVTLAIFILALWAWIFTRITDTYIALLAALATVVTGVLPVEDFTGSLGNQIIWLLVAATLLAQGVTRTGLADRLTGRVIGREASVRALFYLLSISLFFTAFAIPSTSGRAALALPVFLALAQALRDHPNTVKALSLLIPSVILLSAVSSYLGAGAHLITDELVRAYGGQPIGFVRWFIWGAPLGLLSSLLCTELILRLFLTSRERSYRLDFSSTLGSSHPMSRGEKTVLCVLCGVVLLWSTEPVHGGSALLVALAGALVVTAPGVGVIKLADGLREVPWSLLIFMATTLTLGSALTDSGAASWLAETLLMPVAGMGATVFLGLVILVSTLSHLFIQSRSARSTVLIPLVITAASPLGLDPQAMAFISTAAAGFCHTLTSSAKPVALFSDIDDLDTYTAGDLLKLSAWLAPAHMLLIGIFTAGVWPLLGMRYGP